MALTKVTGHVVKPDTNIQFHNTKSTGIVTFTHTSNATSSTTGALQVTGGVGIVKDLHVGGNITVGGTITYDDVTNIDSLGIITARTDIHLGQSLAHLGDTDTKITFDTDEIKFDTANEQRLCIRPNGKIGIGTTNPSGNLTIHGGAGNPGLALKRNTGGGDVASISWASDSANYAMINYRDAAPHGLQFYSGGTADSNLSMIIRLNGNVGIGSEIPTQKLDVNGTSQFQDDVILTNSNHVTQILKAGGSSSDLHIDFKDSDNNLEARIFCASDQGDLRFYTGGNNERVRIKSSGHFGINETNPIHQLSIGINTSTAYTTTKNISNTTNNDFIGLNLTNKNTGSTPEIGMMFQAGTSGAGQYTLNCLRTGGGTADLIFRTRSGGGSSSAEVLRFTSAGNVGINETAPSEKLQIDGDILLGGQANSSESNYAVKFEYNNHQFAKIVGDGRDSSGYGDIDFYTSSGSGVSNLTQRMSIRADGKIGIGDFTSATPDSMLHINGISATAQIRLQRTNAAANTNDYGRIYFESTTNVLTGEISVARETAENNGYMHFNTASSGTLYERLRITSAGVVSVNTANLLNAFEVNYGGGFVLMMDGAGNINQKRASGSNGGLIIKTSLNSGSWGTGGGFIALKPNGVTNGLHVDRNGRVMVLTDSPGVATGDEFTIASSDTTHTGMTILSGTSHEGNIFFADTDAGSAGIIRYEHNNNAMVFKTNSEGQEKMRITSGGDVLFNDSTNSIYNDTSGGGMNFKANGQIVTKKQATSQADPLVWLNDTGQTTNRTIVLAQDGSEKGHIGLNGNNLTIGVSGAHRVQLAPAYGASYPTSRGSLRLGGGNATNGFPLIGYNNSGTRIATHVCTGSFYGSSGMIIIKTTLPKHNTGYTMWSCRITGYAYSANTGGAIDCVVGCYTGEGNYYNPTVTGTYPVAWRDYISFATITTGDHNGHLCIRLGQTSTGQICEIAVTDFVWGYSSVSDVMAEGWSMVCLTSDSGYNTNVVNAIHRSNEFYNDEFQVLGSGTGELLTNRKGRGGTIMGTYQYTQMNQGNGYHHLIRSPHGHTDITDSYADRTWAALITVGVDNTSTIDNSTTYYCRDNVDDNNSLQIYHHLGYSGSGDSNRVNMVVDSGRPAWRMSHGGGYRVTVTVQFLAGGKQNGTYDGTTASYTSN